MASLLDRYIHAVERHLAPALRHDIGAELRETIQSRMDEEATEKCRALTEDEQAAVLKSVGRPVVVATKYGAVQHLIGPAVYPYYLATLKTLALVGAPLAVVAVVVGAIGADRAWQGVFAAISAIATTALVAFALTTLIFRRIEHLKPDFDSDWDPEDLPELQAKDLAVPRAVSISQVAVMTVYFLWWIDQLPFPSLLRIASWTGADGPHMSSAWDGLYRPIAALIGIQILLHVVDVWQPRVPKWRLAAEMLCDLLSLGIFYVLVNADELVATPAAGRWASYHELLNDGAKAWLLVLGIFVVIGLIKDAKRLWAPITSPGGPPSARCRPTGSAI